MVTLSSQKEVNKINKCASTSGNVVFSNKLTTNILTNPTADIVFVDDKEVVEPLMRLMRNESYLAVQYLNQNDCDRIHLAESVVKVSQKVTETFVLSLYKKVNNALYILTKYDFL